MWNIRHYGPPNIATKWNHAKQWECQADYLVTPNGYVKNIRKICKQKEAYKTKKRKLKRCENLQNHRNIEFYNAIKRK